MNRLFVKLLTSYVLVLLTTIVVIFAVLSYFYTESLFSAREQQLIDNGIRLADTYEASFNPFQSQILLRTRLDAIAGTLRANISITGPEGLITMTTRQQAEGRIILNAQDVEKVLMEGAIVTRRGYEEVAGDQVVTAIVPIKSRDNVVGAVVLHSPMSETLQGIYTARRLLVYAGILAILAGVLVSYVLSRRITAPIAQMTEASEAMAMGRFDRRVEVHGSDEIASLGHAFNALSHKLGESIQALTEEKRKIESILVAMNEGLVAVDTQGKIILTNPALYDYLAGPIEELSAKDNLSDDPVFAGVLPAFERALQGEDDIVDEIHLGGKTIIVYVTPITGEDSNQVMGAVAILRDMSEKERLDRMRRHFLANVSHELKTPLTSIRGFAQAILEGVVEGEEQSRRYLHVIMDESLRLIRLVNTLLDLSKIESDAIKLHLEPVDIGELVADTIEALKPLIDDRAIDVTYDIAPLPSVQADRDRLTQISVNLIDNALRHAPKDGKVLITAGLNEAGDRVVMTVENNGPPIDPEDLDRIWDRFYKTDKARRYSPKVGTGLGLVIVKELIEKHGGRVEAMNIAGEGDEWETGVRFMLELPLKQAPSGSGAAIR